MVAFFPLLLAPGEFEGLVLGLIGGESCDIRVARPTILTAVARDFPISCNLPSFSGFFGRAPILSHEMDASSDLVVLGSSSLIGEILWLGLSSD